MNVAFLDLSRQVAALRPELEAAVASVLDSGRFVLGPAVESFERSFAEYVGGDHAVGVASGTEAITIALRASGVGPGDEVVTTANSGVPTVAAIEAAGAVPVLVDPNRDTQTMDPARLERAVNERTRALVPVHLYGRCADMGALTEFAHARGLKVIEDAAQAHGAEHRGARAGTLGDAAAFSFYPTKNLGALGDAGAVVTSDPETAERARMLRVYGERARYESVLAGRNSRLDPLQAAMLEVKLGRLDAWNERRRQLATYYHEELADSGLVLPTDDPEGRHVYHLYVVRTKLRDRLRERLSALGVETLIHYPRAVHRHPAYRHLARDELSISEALATEVLSLPLYPELSDAEAEAVTKGVRGALSR